MSGSFTFFLNLVQISPA